MNSGADSISAVPRILPVDDNADAILILSMALRLKGYAVQTCYSGQEALTIAQSWRPQAILLEISLPGMDGYETCRRLREKLGGQRVVVIAVTGYGQGEDRRRTQEAGFDDHLVKPVDMTLLPGLLTTLINHAQTSA